MRYRRQLGVVAECNMAANVAFSQNQIYGAHYSQRDSVAPVSQCTKLQTLDFYQNLLEKA